MCLSVKISLQSCFYSRANYVTLYSRSPYKHFCDKFKIYFIVSFQLPELTDSNTVSREVIIAKSNKSVCQRKSLEEQRAFEHCTLLQ